VSQQQVQRVETLFLHERGDRYDVVVQAGGERVLRGKLDCKETNAGPRPGKFRVVDGTSEEPRPPEEFVDLARRADRIRISEQTSSHSRDELRELLDGYQLSAKVVRTCRYCATDGRYSPINSDTAIKAGRDMICRDCAREEL